MFPLKNNSNKENHRRPRKTPCPNLQKKNHRRPQKKKIIAPHRETLCPNLLSENKRDFLSGKTMSVNNQSHYEKKYFLNNKSSSCKFVFLVSRNKQIKSVCLCVECVPPIKSVCSKLQSRGKHILHLENTFYLEVEGGEHLKKRPTVWQKRPTNRMEHLKKRPINRPTNRMEHLKKRPINRPTEERDLLRKIETYCMTKETY